MPVSGADDAPKTSPKKEKPSSATSSSAGSLLDALNRMKERAKLGRSLEIQEKDPVQTKDQEKEQLKHHEEVQNEKEKTVQQGLITKMYLLRWR